MARALIGTVAVRNGAAVCVKPDGEVFAIGGKPATFQVPFGGLFERDAGKRIYRIDGHFYMENDDQRKARLGR